jgi:ribosomal protein S3AE
MNEQELAREILRETIEEHATEKEIQQYLQEQHPEAVAADPGLVGRVREGVRNIEI